MLDLGKSISHIARELKIDRKTVRKIKDKVQSGEIEPPVIERKSILDDYKDFLLQGFQDNLSTRIMHRKLV